MALDSGVFRELDPRAPGQAPSHVLAPARPGQDGHHLVRRGEAVPGDVHRAQLAEGLFIVGDLNG